MARYKLKLKRLDFVSPVDTPAQTTARVLLIKRDGKTSGYARAVKVSDELGLVFCWAFTSKASGADYYDLQDDNIDEDFVKAAAEFMQSGGTTDEMHDGRPDGRVVFAMPLTAEIAKAFGIETDTTGLMVALKPSADVLEKFKSGEYTGVSIEGIGERTKVSRKDADGDSDYKCAGCGQYMKAEETACKGCGGMPTGMKRYPSSQGFFDNQSGSVWSEYGLDQPIVCASLGKREALHCTVRKGTWSTATVDDFPDSSFLYVEGGGTKDSDGKTTPRSLRHFPYRDENGKVDVDHLRAAVSDIPKSSLPATLRNKLQVKAEKLLAAQHKKDAGKRLTKRAYLTTAAAGHTHLLDDGDVGGGPSMSGNTDYQSMPNEANGGYHCHPWVLADDGTFVIGEAENHDHSVLDVNATDGDDDEDDASAGKRAGNSTPQLHINHGDHMDELKKQLADALAKIADVSKRYERIEKMTGAHKAHWAGLDGTAAEAFLAKSDADRDAVLADVTKRNEVEYTADDGSVYRKSDDPRLVTLAKSNDANARKAIDADLTKRAEALSGMPGSLEVRKFFLKAAEYCSDDKLKPQLIAALKASSDATQRLFSASDHRLSEGFELPANGSDPAHGGAVETPSSKLKKYVETFQATHKIESYPQALAKALREDPKAGELYAAVHN